MRGVLRLVLCLSIVVSMATVVSASVITLTFEGVGDGNAVGTFYPGIVFNVFTASVDSDSGGTGSFANEPSSSTVIFGSGSGMRMDVAGGFTESFSFFYNADTIGNVVVRDGLGGTGATLASFGLLNNRGGCTAAGDPDPPAVNGNISCWTEVTIFFSGTALSVTFPSASTYFYDHFQLNTVDATAVPEPGSFGLALGGGLAIMLFRRRFQKP